MQHLVRHLLLTGALALGVNLSALHTPTSAAQGLGTPATPLPLHLRDTGLYVEGSREEVRPGNLPFSPQYPLWSDGAAKRRWLHLPEGAFIDASRPDAWEFPPGTRLWKEFSHAGRPVETRYIERAADGTWRYATYVWNDDGSDAVLAPAAGIVSLPVAVAPDGRYDVPARADCAACHESAAVPVLGVGALQLSADRDPGAPHAALPVPGEIDLRSLVASGRLRHLPEVLLDNPPRIAAASLTERAALGYLHANCGHCHNDGGTRVPVRLALAQSVVAPAASVDRVLASAVAMPSRYRHPGTVGEAQVVVPGQPQASVLDQRMRSRHPQVQMPPLGTRLPDPEGLALVDRWITYDLLNRKEPSP